MVAFLSVLRWDMYELSQVLFLSWWFESDSSMLLQWFLFLVVYKPEIVQVIIYLGNFFLRHVCTQGMDSSTVLSESFCGFTASFQGHGPCSVSAST